MTTRIRLARRGTTKRPYYHIVIADKTRARDGKFIERIGLYDPMLAENKTKLDMDRAQYWLSVGARPTDRVVKIFKLNGLDVPANMMDHVAQSAGKKKAVAARDVEKKKAAELREREDATRAKKKEDAAAAPAAG